MLRDYSKIKKKKSDYGTVLKQKTIFPQNFRKIVGWIENFVETVRIIFKAVFTLLVFRISLVFHKCFCKTNHEMWNTHYTLVAFQANFVFY